MKEVIGKLLPRLVMALLLGSTLLGLSGCWHHHDDRWDHDRDHWDRDHGDREHWDHEHWEH